MKFSKLTEHNLKRLTEGKSIHENGIEAKRLSSGDIAFYAKVMVEGKLIRELLGKQSEGFTLTMAKHKIGELAASARQGTFKTPKQRRLTFERAALDYLDAQEASNGKNIKAKRQHLRDHLIPFFKNILLSKVSSFDADRYRKHRLEQNNIRHQHKGISSSTVNRELATLRHMLNFAEDAQWIDRAPRLRLTKENNRREVYLKPKELLHLYQTAKEDHNPYIYYFVRLAAESGMRRGEILSLKASYFDFEDLIIRLPDSKTGARIVFMTPDLASLIQEYVSHLSKPDDYLFPARSKKGHWVEPHSAFERVVQQANLGQKGVTAHVLRHTFVTLCQRSGTGITDVAALAGHSSISTTALYSQHRAPDLRNAVIKLGDFIHQGSLA